MMYGEVYISLGDKKWHEGVYKRNYHKAYYKYKESTIRQVSLLFILLQLVVSEEELSENRERIERMNRNKLQSLLKESGELAELYKK